MRISIGISFQRDIMIDLVERIIMCIFQCSLGKIQGSIIDPWILFIFSPFDCFDNPLSFFFVKTWELEIALYL